MSVRDRFKSMSIDRLEMEAKVSAPAEVKSFSVRADAELLHKIDCLAEYFSMSRNQMVVELLDGAVTEALNGYAEPFTDSEDAIKSLLEPASWEGESK